MGLDARWDAGDTAVAFLALHYARAARRILRSLRGRPAVRPVAA